MKLCSRCEIKKGLSEFAINAANLDGKDYWCKACRSDYHKIKYPRSMKPMFKDKDSKQCRRCEVVKPRTHFRSNGGNKISYCRDCYKEVGLTSNLSKYNLTIDQYIDMFEKQEGKCYICKNDEPSHTKKRLSVDHDHSCCGKGKGCPKCVRMLLCSQCNMALGAVKDNIEVLRSMVKYLEEYS